MTAAAQRSFSKGELSPGFWPRTDLAAYATGLKVCRNSKVLTSGGVENRSGTRYLGATKFPDKKSRLLPFAFDSTDTWLIEMGDLYIRFWINESPVTISGADAPAWVLGGGYGPSALATHNGTIYYATFSSVGSANDEPGVGVNWQFFWQAMPSTAYEFATAWSESEVPEVQFVQKDNAIYFSHQNHPVMRLERISTKVWVFSMYPQTIQKFLGSIARRITNSPYSPGGTPNPGTAYPYKFVPYLADGTKLPFYTNEDMLQNISGITAANPAVVTTAASHLMTTGDYVRFGNGSFATQNVQRLGTPVTVMDYIRGKSFRITVLTATTFSIDGFDSTTLPAWSSVDPGRVAATTMYIAGPGFPVTINVYLTSPASPSVAVVDVYRNYKGVWGYVGSVNSGLSTYATLLDPTAIPDLTKICPPDEQDFFSGPGNFPSVVSTYQQRLLLAGTKNKPQEVWASRSGNLYDFTISDPLQSDDEVSFDLVGRIYSPIVHCLDIGSLLLLGANGELNIQGDASGTLTPTDINPRTQSEHGSSKVRPVVVGRNVVYLQARGNVLRDMTYAFQSYGYGYAGNDMTVYAPHLFKGYTILQLAYQQNPLSIVWAVRDDGTLLGLTYDKEEQFLAWHHHDTLGSFEAVCTLPSPGEDILYTVVKRHINGADVRYIERFETRLIDPTDQEEMGFMDASLVYDGRNTNPALAVEIVALVTGSTWDNDSTVSLLVPAASSPNVGNAYQADFGAGVVVLEIISVIDGTHYEVRPERLIAASEQLVASSSWALAVDDISGLDHLEGQAVSILGDGGVVASPNNSAYADYRPVVTAGKIHLRKPCGYVRIGLPYVSDIQTLDIDTANGEPLSFSNKMVGEIAVYVEKTRGLFFGGSLPTDDTNAGMFELKARESNDIQLLTGLQRELINSEWSTGGDVSIRQVDPLPMTVTAIMPRGLIDA